MAFAARPDGQGHVKKYGTYIYLHKNEKAYLCSVVSFFADTGCGNPSRPVHFIDVNTGKVLHSFDSLNYADCTGPGGDGFQSNDGQ